jgi:hypothetical protein
MVNNQWIKVYHEIVHKHSKEQVSSNSEFLTNTHKHFLEIKISIINDDKNIDLYMFQKFVETLLLRVSYDFKEKSYEMFADYLNTKIIEKYPGNSFIIEFIEDKNIGYVFCFDETGLNTIIG